MNNSFEVVKHINTPQIDRLDAFASSPCRAPCQGTALLKWICGAELQPDDAVQLMRGCSDQHYLLHVQRRSSLGGQQPGAHLDLDALPGPMAAKMLPSASASPAAAPPPMTAVGGTASPTPPLKGDAGGVLTPGAPEPAVGSHSASSTEAGMVCGGAAAAAVAAAAVPAVPQRSARDVAAAAATAVAAADSGLHAGLPLVARGAGGPFKVAAAAGGNIADPGTQQQQQQARQHHQRLLEEHQRQLTQLDCRVAKLHGTVAALRRSWWPPLPRQALAASSASCRTRLSFKVRKMWPAAKQAQPAQAPRRRQQQLTRRQRQQ